MDYKDFSEEAISKQDKEFAKVFENFVNGRMRSAETTGRELSRAHRYLATADVQGVHRLHAPTGAQLPKGLL